MRIVYLTAGTGNFYCGSCLRDHSLAKGLRAMGHDVVIMPLYLPLVTEDHDQGDTPIFLGGINSYLQQKFSFFRKTPRWLDRLLDSRPLLKLAAKFSGMTKPKDLGEITVATLLGVDGPQMKEFQRVLDWMKEHSKPDVVCLSNALLSGFAEPIKNQIGAKVVCSLQGEDTFIEKFPSTQRNATWDHLADQTAFVDGYVAVSEYHADIMSRQMRIPPDKLHVVPNGIDLTGFDQIKRIEDHPPTIGFLAALIPAKGLETLVDAFISLHQSQRIPQLRLHIAGSSVPGQDGFRHAMQKKLDHAGCHGSYRINTNISREEKLAFFTDLDVFSVPATYGESFGLYVLEALAAGVPVVQPDHAAFPEILAKTGGGRLCQPDNTKDLAEALANLLENREASRQLGAQGREAVFVNYTSHAMANRFEQVLNEVVKDSAGITTSQSALQPETV